MSLKGKNIFHALIRTHHITSRKKVGKLQTASKHCETYVVLHSGKCPGVMYCEGETEEKVKRWVDVVHSLNCRWILQPLSPSGGWDLAVANYLERDEGNTADGIPIDKDYQLVARPAPFMLPVDQASFGKLVEIHSLKEFRNFMHSRGLLEWWRRGMGYSTPE